MSEPIRVFVDARSLLVAEGTTALGAIAELDSELAERIRAGAAYLTDGRGIQLAPDSPVFAGAILRVVISARNPGVFGPSAPLPLCPSDEADAHA